MGRRKLSSEKGFSMDDSKEMKEAQAYVLENYPIHKNDTPRPDRNYPTLSLKDIRRIQKKEGKTVTLGILPKDTAIYMKKEGIREIKVNDYTRGFHGVSGWPSMRMPLSGYSNHSYSRLPAGYHRMLTIDEVNKVRKQDIEPLYTKKEVLSFIKLIDGGSTKYSGKENTLYVEKQSTKDHIMNKFGYTPFRVQLAS